MRLTASGFGNLVTMPRSMIMSLDIDRIDKPITHTAEVPKESA